jgi:hypothetical protein
MQADSLKRITKQWQTVFKKGDNVVIPIPTDPRNIKGVVTQVNDCGGYNVGTLTCNRSQTQFTIRHIWYIHSFTLTELNLISTYVAFKLQNK